MSKSEFPKFCNTKKRHFLDVWKLFSFEAVSIILYLLRYVSSYLRNKRVGLKIFKIQVNCKVCDSSIYVVVVDQSLSCVLLFATPWAPPAHRLPCPSLSPRVCSDLCPMSQWCFLTISSSATPFFFCLQSSPASGSFPVSQLFVSSGQYWSFNFSISPSSEYSGLISFRIDWFDLLAVQGTLKSLLQDHNLKASVYIYIYIHTHTYACMFLSLSLIYCEIICSKWTLNMKGNGCSKRIISKEISQESRKV